MEPAATTPLDAFPANSSPLAMSLGPKAASSILSVPDTEGVDIAALTHRAVMNAMAS